MNVSNISIKCGKEVLAAVQFSSDNALNQVNPGIIICHGAFEYKENFFELAHFLVENNIIAIVLDMPGHGASTGERFHVDIGLWVEAIHSAIDYAKNLAMINSDCIGAFGFSSGGTAVLESASSDQRLKMIVTLDATVKNYLNLWDTISFKAIIYTGKVKRMITGSDLRLKLIHVLKKAKVAYDPTVNDNIICDKKMLEAYSSLPFPGAGQCAFVDTIKRTHRIKIPTLIIHGNDDHIDPPKTALELFDSLTCEKAIEILTNSGHCGHLDTQKDKIMKLTAEWVLKHQ